ncbi:uncharacterized protein [Nicotiana sylvestris]|uniref:Membrane insertase YidC-like n=2 Tax=Nicotiana TaxID=4085 RepID=A0A1S3XN21_TOBAC|nr:PREDICTED: uncharacterized protein LOC104213971 [Nicotiana sylvestris]XP_016441341.1 PREDICTED: uncharacterized protein LOC107766943 [Nicotiana tabacum]
MSEREALPPLFKQKSWSPDMLREEAWLKRKGNYCTKLADRRRSKSVTDDDLEELRACFDLGFGFDSPDLDPKLTETFPALELYQAVNKQYGYTLSRSSSSSTVASDFDTTSFVGSSSSIVDPGEDPEMVKTRLRQWAQVVACSVRQSSSSS